MIIYSHRGNLKGSNPETENTVPAIIGAMSAGFRVEVDVRFFEGSLWLGHDKPVEYMPSFILKYAAIIYHCKDIPALLRMIELREKGYDVHYFFHDKDDVTLTSKGYVWTYPGKQLIKHSIAVLPETVKSWDISYSYGVCTDYPNNYK